MLTHWQSNLGMAAICFFLILALGLLYESLGERRDARRNPAPGSLISVNGRKLHLLCKGSATPTVVIEQGAGELSRFWWPLQDQVAEFAQVCTYDRAGFAWSAPADGPRSVENRAEELRTLLSNAGLPGPYILVAHSYGGLIVRNFAENHPADVAGLVLVDTPAEASIFQPVVLDFYSKAEVMNRVVGFAARFGLLRLLKHWLPLDRFGLWLDRPSEYAALCDDLASLQHVPPNRRTTPLPGSLGNLPVAVITHGKAFPGPFAVLETNWKKGQEDLAALSTNSRFTTAQNSNHMIQIDEPGVVLDAIRLVHRAAQSHSPINGA